MKMIHFAKLELLRNEAFCNKWKIERSAGMNIKLLL